MTTRTPFFYCDPPYVGTSCGHYEGYTLRDYTRLLDCLKGLKGKFLLSSYPSETLEAYTEANQWKTQALKLKVCVGTVPVQKDKIEQLTGNYTLEKEVDIVELMEAPELALS